MGRHSDYPRDISAKADVEPPLRVSGPALLSTDILSLDKRHDECLYARVEAFNLDMNGRIPLDMIGTAWENIPEKAVVTQSRD